MHAFAVFVDGSSGIMIQQNLQLMGGASVIQQGSGKVLALLAQFLILILQTERMIKGQRSRSRRTRRTLNNHLEFMLEKTQASQFPGEFEGRQNRILRG